MDKPSARLGDAMKTQKVLLRLLIIAPDQELAKTGEGYANLMKELELPFVPFIGLKLSLDRCEKKKYRKQYEELSTITKITGIFEIKEVYYNVGDGEWALNTQKFKPTLEEFHAAIELCILAFGFEN